jgi:hypothetical protein
MINTIGLFKLNLCLILIHYIFCYKTNFYNQKIFRNKVKVNLLDVAPIEIIAAAEALAIPILFTAYKSQFDKKIEEMQTEYEKKMDKTNELKEIKELKESFSMDIKEAINAYSAIYQNLQTKVEVSL